MTIVEIARRIESLRVGTLPESCGSSLRIYTDADGNDMELPDDIARHMLIGAMVMATGAKRVGGAWSLTMPCQVGDARAFCLNLFLDSDHGNDPLRSLLAAFERVYAKEDK